MTERYSAQAKGQTTIDVYGTEGAVQPVAGRERALVTAVFSSEEQLGLKRSSGAARLVFQTRQRV